MIQGEAYWISPNGEIYKIENRHINFVGKNPSLFEMNIDEYQDYFKKYNEPFGWEGFGRKEMFVDIFKRGWIRIRENSKTGWTAELCNLNEISKKNLLFWCKTIGNKGGKFSSENITINVLCNESNQIEINFMIIKSTISELIENGFLNK